MNAKPSLNINAIVFWVVVSSTALGLTYQYGFDNGFEKARSVPAKCSDKSPDGKALNNISYDEKTGKTQCEYIRAVKNKGRWGIEI